MTKSEKLVEIALKYWIEKLKDPKYDIGDPTSRGTQLNAFFDSLSEPIDDLTEEKFREHFTNLVLSELDREGAVKLEIDYQPYGTMRNIIDNSGVSGNSIPVKTRMDISLDYIEVYSPSDGYKYLYVSEKYLQELHREHLLKSQTYPMEYSDWKRVRKYNQKEAELYFDLLETLKRDGKLNEKVNDTTYITETIEG